ncbi:MAG: hypothetical protein G01um101425_573 [Candidatus Peregrinibacteria bacterium Gr01-1014_25]|nr:MAG: hypothetical protein G01um101425_573 [Candidatus Peregrinibacteria bacterium Gr01-1014_25]
MPIAYQFTRSERGIFTEIYFPKRAAYYGAIFGALEKGYSEDEVKDYLHRNAEALLEELREYPGLLDPRKYDAEILQDRALTITDAKTRIEMYQSSFRGWSTYSVDGVFFGSDDKMYEESTQVVRLIHRFPNVLTRKEEEEGRDAGYSDALKAILQQAKDEGCTDVLRAVLFWVVARRGRLNEAMVWSKAERARFIGEHAPWAKKKLTFVKRHFTAIAKEAQKAVDDIALFLFGYLVRKFSDKVLAREYHEEEIWATGLVALQLNIVRRVEN